MGDVKAVKTVKAIRLALSAYPFSAYLTLKNSNLDLVRDVIYRYAEAYIGNYIRGFIMKLQYNKNVLIDNLKLIPGVRMPMVFIPGNPAAIAKKMKCTSCSNGRNTFR